MATTLYNFIEKQLFFSIFLSMFFINLIMVNVAYSDYYYTVDQYKTIHPEQVRLMERFKDMVKKPVEPLKKKIEVKVSIVLPGKQLSDYWRRSLTSFEQRMKRYKLKFKTYEYIIKPKERLKTQIELLGKALGENPDYLIFTLDARRHQRIIERILITGKPKVLLLNITTPLKKWEGMQPLLYSGFDHIEGTRLIARSYIERISGPGSYISLLTKPGYLSEVRGSVFNRYINNHSGLKLKSIYHINIDKKEAFNATMEAVDEFKNLSFVYASTTDIALGAIEAISKAGLKGKIMVNGWGGGSAELKSVINRDMNFTVMRMNDDSGAALADAIVMDLTGRSDQVPKIFSGELVLVEKGISKEKLKQLKDRAFRLSGN